MDFTKIMEIKDTPSAACKRAWLKSLAELVRTSEVSEQTLINWHKNKPRLFAVVVAGAVRSIDGLAAHPLQGAAFDGDKTHEN